MEISFSNGRGHSNMGLGLAVMAVGAFSNRPRNYGRFVTPEIYLVLVLT